MKNLSLINSILFQKDPFIILIIHINYPRINFYQAILNILFATNYIFFRYLLEFQNYSSIIPFILFLN